METLKFKFYTETGIPDFIGQQVLSFGKKIGNVIAYNQQTGEVEVEIFEKFAYELLRGKQVGLVNLWGLEFRAEDNV